MHSNKRRLAITGVTGLLGRNLLFEVIKNHLSRLDQLEIFVFGRRDRQGVPLQERLRHILLGDGAEYLGIGGQLLDSLVAPSSNVIKYVEMDFDSDVFHIEQDVLNDLRSSPLDWFFHVAGLTDLRSTPAALMNLRRTNIEGTRRVLELVSHLRVNEFCYVGTAYACGMSSGRLQPDYVNPAETFRSPYEKSKVEAEVLVREFAKSTGVRCRYFRPATICGRLLELPLGSVSNFDVFYSWPAFFFRLKLKGAGVRGPVNHNCELNVRVCYSRKSGLNIVPVDYVVKVMYLICEQDDPGESYHLVNNVETPHDFYIPRMLDAVGISGVTQVDRVPEDRTFLENLYYRTIGSLYTPYITCEPMLFDVSNLQRLLKKFDLRCPTLDEKALGILMHYAKDRDFGLTIRQ